MATSSEVVIWSMTDVGALVREARAKHGWTQADLCERTGFSRPWLVDIENGRHDRAEMGRVLRLLHAVGIDVVARPSQPADHRSGDLDLDVYLDSFGSQP